MGIGQQLADELRCGAAMRWNEPQVRLATDGRQGCEPTGRKAEHADPATVDSNVGEPDVQHVIECRMNVPRAIDKPVRCIHCALIGKVVARVHGRGDNEAALRQREREVHVAAWSTAVAVSDQHERQGIADDRASFARLIRFGPSSVAGKGLASVGYQTPIVIGVLLGSGAATSWKPTGRSV